jgi:hypothetical protein
MREKNVVRAAEALYNAQADDKNALLASRITDKEVAKMVKDQGRALVVLEKLVLPYGKNAFEKDEMSEILLKKLKKKGHRIQDDETPDDEQYAAEKEKYMAERLEKVPTLLGMQLSDLEEKEPKEEELQLTLAGDPVPIIRYLPDFAVDNPSRPLYKEPGFWFGLLISFIVVAAIVLIILAASI